MTLRQVKAKLAGVRRAKTFIPRRDCKKLARKMLDIVQGIKACATSPKQGVELVAAFYNVDRGLFERCDDSSGYVSPVFRGDALELFVKFAKECDDKPWLADVVFELDMDNGYGARDGLLEQTSEFLPESQLRSLIARYWERAESIPDSEEYADFRRWDCYSGVATIARQLGDAPLYEKATRARAPELGVSVCTDIARVYLEAGEAETALNWIQRHETPDTGQFRDAYDSVLSEIYSALGQSDKQEETLWSAFRDLRTIDNWETLITAVGENKRDTLLAREAQVILDQQDLDYNDAIFLIRTNKMEEASQYVLKHWEIIDGNHYYTVLPMAQHFDDANQWLAATVCYRKLLDSTLNKAQSRYYHHAVRYWKILDRISSEVNSWGNIPTHKDFVDIIERDHAKKVRFWEMCAG